MKNKLYLATAIASFIASGADIAAGYYVTAGYYVLAPIWAACGGIWIYLWSRKD